MNVKNIRNHIFLKIKNLIKDNFKTNKSINKGFSDMKDKFTNKEKDKNKNKDNQLYQNTVDQNELIKKAKEEAMKKYKNFKNDIITSNNKIVEENFINEKSDNVKANSFEEIIKHETTKEKIFDFLDKINYVDINNDNKSNENNNFDNNFNVNNTEKSQFDDKHSDFVLKKFKKNEISYVYKYKSTIYYKIISYRLMFSYVHPIIKNFKLKYKYNTNLTDLAEFNNYLSKDEFEYFLYYDENEISYNKYFTKIMIIVLLFITSSLSYKIYKIDKRNKESILLKIKSAKEQGEKKVKLPPLETLSKKEKFKFIIGYSMCFLTLLLHISFHKRNVKSVLYNSFDKSVKMLNSNNTVVFKSIIKDLKFLNFERKNLFEIHFFDHLKGKNNYIMLNKDAIYDIKLLSAICSDEITDLEFV